jgi:hypothetical protein
MNDAEVSQTFMDFCTELMNDSCPSVKLYFPKSAAFILKNAPENLRTVLSRELFRPFSGVPPQLWITEVIEPIRTGTYHAWYKKWMVDSTKLWMTLGELKVFIDHKLSFIASRATWTYCLAAMCEDINQNNMKVPEQEPVMTLQIAAQVLGYDPVEAFDSRCLDVLLKVPGASTKYKWMDITKPEMEFYGIAAWRYLRERCRREGVVRLNPEHRHFVISRYPKFNIVHSCRSTSHHGMM